MSSTESSAPPDQNQPEAPANTSDDAELGVRVRVHPGLCQGWGNCHRFAAAVYSLDAEGYVDFHMVEVPPELADVARLGAEICPASAISIIAMSAKSSGRPPDS